MSEAEEKKGQDVEMKEKEEKDAAIATEEKREEEAITDPSPSAAIREEVELIVAETKSSGKVTDGMARLLLLEKKQRQGEDEPNTIFIAKQMVELCYEQGDWTLLVEQVVVLSRRRSQFRRVIMRIVQQCMSWIDEAPDKETQLKMIDALLSVTEGKMFVEVEKARLTRMLAKIKETEGKIAEAADIMQELQIETFGSMEKKEKCDFLLEQVRLCLAKRDFVRAGIIRNKITSKILSNLRDLEVKYWNLSLIYFYHHNRSFLELSKAYRRLKELLEEPADKVEALANSIFALVLSPFNNEQSDLLHRVLEAEKKMLEELPILRELLKLLTTVELIGWPLPPETSSRLNSFKFTGVVDNDQNWEELLHDRVVQHNIRVIAKYYTQIRTARMSHFLGVSEDESERYLSELVTNGTVFARIDRLDGIIRFRKKETPNLVLNQWRDNIDALLGLVDKTCHQIHKEMVVHATKGKSRA